MGGVTENRMRPQKHRPWMGPRGAPPVPARGAWLSSLIAAPLPGARSTSIPETGCSRSDGRARTAPRTWRSCRRSRRGSARAVGRGRGGAGRWRPRGSRRPSSRRGGAAGELGDGLSGRHGEKQKRGSVVRSTGHRRGVPRAPRVRPLGAGRRGPLFCGGRTTGQCGPTGGRSKPRLKPAAAHATTGATARCGRCPGRGARRPCA